MASQITHIVYGKVVLDKFLKDKGVDEDKFYIGTVFPDIRYLGAIEREKTHITEPKQSELLNNNDSFCMGVYAHSMIDREHARVVEERGLWNIIQRNKFSVYAWKFIEDVVTYSYFDDWESVSKALNNILDEETSVVDENVAKKWHQILSVYFQQPPSIETALVFARELKGFSPEVVREMRMEMEKIEGSPEAMKIIRDTHSDLFPE